MSQNSNQTKDNTVLPNNVLTQEIKKLIIPTNTETNENPELSFDDYISNQIDNMQRETYFSIKMQLDSLESNYLSFKNSIKNFIVRKMQVLNQTFNINDANLYIQQFAKTNIYEHINNIIDIHKKMIFTLKEHFRILKEFLQIDKYLQKNKPAEEYLINNLGQIYSNWLFSKIDFGKYKLNSFFNQELLDRQIISYINKYPHNKFSSYKLIKENNTNQSPLFESDSQPNIENLENNVLQTNKNILTKLQIVGAKDLPANILESFTFNKVTKFGLTHCPLKVMTNIQSCFPSLTNISIQNYVPDLKELDLISSLKLKLQRISFVNMELITSSFNKIMTILIGIDEVRNNLTHLSFENNLISVVDFGQFLFLPKKMHKLKEMNFEKNRIYKFSHNPELTPSLKVINMSVNSFGKSYFNQFKKEKILLFLGNNIYLTNPNNNKQYYDILKYQLEHFNYNLDYLTFNGMFTKNSCHLLHDIHIHKSIQISVRKLDLSNCSLDDETLIRFFKTNPGFLELRYLILNDNYLSDNFFQMFIDNNFHLKFPRLKCVIATSNEIEGNKFSAIRNFIIQNKALSCFVLMKNPFCKKLRMCQTKEDEMKKKPIENVSKEDAGKINEFAGILKLVEEINKREKGEGRNYLNYNNQNEKGLVIKFDAGEKYSISNCEMSYNEVELLKNKK